MISDGAIIVAPATAAGGALAVIRVSGPGAIELCDRFFRGRQPLAGTPGHTLRYGTAVDTDGTTVDEVVAAVFRAPHSYTGDDTVELSCHGSRYIQQRLLALCLHHGARMADRGEFTARAYLSGRMDLAQAEAVADLIAAESRSAHALAASQMRGHYSERLAGLRDRLLHLVSLLELELDFGEEEVEFADRSELQHRMEALAAETERLARSFTLGNVLKEGVPVAIAGAPNAGKSTLLNRLLGEERAMVSEIAGTTRDTIEEVVDIDGIRFRLIDTAGLRTTSDRLEQMGIDRTRTAVERARIVLQIVDATAPRPEPLSLQPDQQRILLLNKIDALPAGQDPGRIITGLSGSAADGEDADPDATPCVLAISAKEGTGIEQLKGLLRGTVDAQAWESGETIVTNSRHADGEADDPDATPCVLAISAKEGTGIEQLKGLLRGAVDAQAWESGETIVTNSRHAEAFARAGEALRRGLNLLTAGATPDLLSEEIREVLRHLDEITGRSITSDQVLQTIFSRFCIGK